MNITDVNMDDYQRLDKNDLTDMTIRQHQLIQILYEDNKVKDLPDGNTNYYMIKDSLRRALEEVFEANACLRNKKWKKTEVLTDIEHYKEELADAIHFHLEAAIFAGKFIDIDMENFMSKYEILDIHERESQRKIKNEMLEYSFDVTHTLQGDTEFGLKKGFETLLRICKMSGMTPEDVHKTYIKKWHVNVWRVKTNY